MSAFAKAGAKEFGFALAAAFGGASAGGATGPNYNPATANYIVSGDSIPTLDDNTGYVVMAHALSGGSMRWPGWGHQGISGSEINEGAIGSNTKDLLYPERLNKLIASIRPGDVYTDNIGTNTLAEGLHAQVIAGKTEIFGRALAAGVALVEAVTLSPSLFNSGFASRTIVNDWIMNLEVVGLTWDGVFYPPEKFICWDRDAAWGGTYVGKTNDNLHDNCRGAHDAARARKAKFKAKGIAYHPLYGTVNKAGNLLANWNLAAGAAGTTSGTSTFSAISGAANPTIPTGIQLICSISGVSWEYETILAYAPIDSMYASAGTFPVLHGKITWTNAGSSGNATVRLAHTGATQPPGTAMDAFAYCRIAGVGAADPVNLYAMSYTAGATVVKWAATNNPLGANDVRIPFGDEFVMRGRSTPANALFGSISCDLSFGIRAGESGSVEFWYGQPYLAYAETVAYEAPSCLNTDTLTLGGARALGPQITSQGQTSAPTITPAVVNGGLCTGRVGQSWKGGGLTFEMAFEKLGADGVTITTVKAYTTVTTTAATTQYTPSGMVTGEKLRPKIRATNSFGSAEAVGLWTAAHA